MKLQRIEYSDLKSRQKENYNYHKIASILADYGYNSMWLNDDWEGADFIAVHIDGNQMLKVQLKGRVTIDQKYLGKDIYIAFSLDQTIYYLYPHDEIFELISAHSDGAKRNGARSIHYIPTWLIPHLEKYKLV
jgi:hypothetical protein